MANNSYYVPSPKVMDPVLRDIFNALTLQGDNPIYHYEQHLKLKEEWPTLWAALDKFVREVDTEIVAGRLG